MSKPNQLPPPPQEIVVPPTIPEAFPCPLHGIYADAEPSQWRAAIIAAFSYPRLRNIISQWLEDYSPAHLTKIMDNAPSGVWLAFNGKGGRP